MQVPSPTPVQTPVTDIAPVYSDQEIWVAPNGDFQKYEQDWFKNDRGKVFIPKGNQWKPMHGIHQATRLGEKAMQQMIKNTSDGIHVTTRNPVQFAHK